jgi:UDPglucose 6-dehydrogenase
VTPSVCVYGLWHLGCVTAACLAAEGFDVIGLDPDPERVAALQDGRPPIAEPGLAELVQSGLANGTLTFTEHPAEALARSDVLWVTFDTPVDDADEADVAWVHAQLERARQHVQPGTLVIVSSQVPVGFSRELERAWVPDHHDLQVACSPENLRLGRAIEVFRNSERVVVGCGTNVQRERVQRLFAPFTERIEWMSLESAEMTKHALNGFLALSVAYANELARICEQLGADAFEVERGLKTEARIGPGAYLAPGPPLAGGTLARDIVFLGQLSHQHRVESPVIRAVLASNAVHKRWAVERVLALLEGVAEPRVALLGLAYKPGTDTLRRSSAVELGTWLAERGITVRALDPAIPEHRPDLGAIEVAADLDDVLHGADVAVIATAWPEFRALDSDKVIRHMRRPYVVDQAGFLRDLADDPRISYVRPGRAPRRPDADTSHANPLPRRDAR